MKKYFLLILLAGFFTMASCSSDDDGNNNQGNEIVGTWVLVDVTPPQIFNVEDCTENSTITFNSDKTGSSTFYLAANDCEAEQTEGNWSYDNGLYYIEVPVLGSQPGEVEFEGEDRFYFSSQEIPGVVLTFERA